MATIGWPGEKSGYSSERLSNSGRPIWTGAVLWMALNVRRKRRCGSGSRAGLQRLVLLQYDDDSETEPGELRACRHLNKAR